MFGYIIRRVVSGLLVLLATSVAVFAFFFYGPSDPAQAYCPETRCTPERLETIRTSLGLDRPVPEQYGEYMLGIVAGNDFEAGAISIKCPAPCLGVSFKLRLPVAKYLGERFPATLSLALGGAAIFLPLGLTMGVMAARVRGTFADKAIVSSSLLINAIPYYLLALLAYLYLINQWAIFPEPGYRSPFEAGPIAWIKGLILAWIMLGIAYSTQYARFSRGSMLETMNQDYVRTARAKGLSERPVMVRHVLGNASIPVVTVMALTYGTILGLSLIHI